ncbi:hypothetical protein N7448_006665 [Penicillium atrosanguineum]|uniref:Uncharacterized protein n=1 Tax=Penicillium atrosanguineum TaxID=1132637 RepID=A0A9W9GYR9_9EURO|nr:uncharacterized protein N7443_010426 [Penicillium atrosanguineum]KAJ5132507.1 hypothetical protein N7448_006665 [Penicillium atrosanguineum]KAJ5137280.1 hypothetical protein N7526_003513 [Penicillium atrosanguineum]KAJ5290173.1 hypothetical protein N7443_010426 [Penicillium atrosanguineum]KAJ5307997.1 hypothetical protein N7476_008653 [Penicillium atrosanguineum]
MFATQLPSSPSTPFRQTSHFSPVRPSPLGPRSSNIATPPWTMGSPTRAGHSQKPSYERHTQSSPAFPTFSINNENHEKQPQQTVPNMFGASTPFFPQQSNIMSPASPSPSARPKYSERYASQIANPMKTSNSLVRSKTRKMFMNRVKNERDGGRFEARGEQMMMMEHLADKRKWEESMARDAGCVMPEFEADEDNMLPDEADMYALNEFISEEEAMQMAMQETMEQNDQQHLYQTQPNTSFSDDEYDDIFMTISDPAQSNQDMDMS